MAPRRYAKLSATERELSNLIRKREFSIRYAREPLAGFPVRRIRDTRHVDVDSLERQKQSDVFKM
jgi:hypothetical protein